MDLLELKVVAIVPEATETVTIFLERVDREPLDYRAGQFLTFLLVGSGGAGPSSDRELRRSYSFSSTPGIDPVAAITVKRVTNGEVSRYLLDHLRVGDKMVSLPAAGRFVLEGTGASQAGLVKDDGLNEPGGLDKSGFVETGGLIKGTRAPESQAGGRPLFFIAAGSGMAPVFSLLKVALVKEGANRVVLISQQHDEESIPFKRALEVMTREYGGRFTWVSFVSSPQKILLKEPTPAGVVHRTGRLNNWWLEKLMGQLMMEIQEGRLLPDGPGEGLLPNESEGGLMIEMPAREPLPDISERGLLPDQSDRGSLDPLFYLCGPPAFMRMAQFTLRVMDFDRDSIKQEHFTVEYVPPPPLLTDATPKKVIVQTGGRGHGAVGDVPVEILSYQFEVAWPATILQAALKQGIPLPYSCKGGRCSTCVAKCVSGKVTMSINEVLTEKDISDGLVLTCVGYAETDVELRLS